MIWVHKDCGGKLLHEHDPFLLVCAKCKEKGTLGDFSMWVHLPNKEAQQKYISQIEREKFEKMISQKVIETYYPQFTTTK